MTLSSHTAETHSAPAVTGDDSTARRLTTSWQRALAGEREAQEEWQKLGSEGGVWEWHDDGVRLKTSGPDWPTLMWRGWEEARGNGEKKLVINVKVSGQAEAAGLSFGPYKDFLTPLESGGGPRHLCLEIDSKTGCWAFSVDGRLLQRQWWNAAVKNVEDLLGGTLSLKAKRPAEVLFQDLVVQTLDVSCQLSVIMTCYRFLQRMRISLRNWCHQSLPSDSYEVLVVNPQSPDGTHEHLSAVARSFPHLRVREIEVEAELVTNKGAMINRAVQESRGEWLWLTDADCLFSPDSAANVLRQIKGQQNHLHYGRRFRLTAAQTDALLAGRIDSLRDFAELHTSAGAPECAPWGYTQIIHRTTFRRVRYRETLNHFAHSDGIFTDECKRRKILPKEVDGLFCLHLDHPFAWYGTNVYL